MPNCPYIKIILKGNNRETLVKDILETMKIL